MAFFTTAFTVLIAGLGIGFAVSLVIFVPLSVYIIPYCLWVGFQNNKGQYSALKGGNCFHMARNATRLYAAWISHRAPSF